MANPTNRKCPRCGKTFVPNPARKNMACLVLHPEGQCCHYSETEVNPKSEDKPQGGMTVTHGGVTHLITEPCETCRQAVKEFAVEREFENADSLAKFFHDTYEGIAPDYGYKTREESAVPWSDVPDKNKALMIDVADRILTAHNKAVAEAEVTLLEKLQSHEFMVVSTTTREGKRFTKLVLAEINSFLKAELAKRQQS